MNVLHLIADWKWTGPVEPTLDLITHLRNSDISVEFAVMKPPAGENRTLTSIAGDRGMPPVAELSFMKRPNLIHNGRDIAKVKALIQDLAIDIIHVHSTQDHIVGGIASRLSARRPLIVRTNHRGLMLPTDPFSTLLFRDMTDCYLSYSSKGLAEDRLHFHWDEWHARLIRPGMNLDRYRQFTPSRPPRDIYGLRPEQFLLGIVARVQRHRRFDLLLDAFEIALKQNPNLLLMVVGRGTHRDEVVIQPAAKRGLDKHMIFTGYVSDLYLETIAAFDAMVFLVPGSDGTCRALREGMAMGKPVITTRRGMIPDIVGGEGEGLLVEESPEQLAQAMLTLSWDLGQCHEMGQRAKERAFQQFSIEEQADQVAECYRSIVKS